MASSFISSSGRLEGAERSFLFDPPLSEDSKSVAVSNTPVRSMRAHWVAVLACRALVTAIFLQSTPGASSTYRLISM